MTGQARWFAVVWIVELLAASAVATGCATFGIVSDAGVVHWVHQTVAQRQPTARDKRFDEIGWAADIRDAIKLGTETERPIFLYTGDGRINTGRC